MVTVLHLFNELTTGGGVRAALALGKYSSRSGKYRHLIAQIKNAPISGECIRLALENGVEILPPGDLTDLFKYLKMADIVQMNWWNSPITYEFFQNKLPEMRLVGWCHVGGQSAPQVITDRVLNFFDFAVACSPYTYQSPAFIKLREEGEGRWAGMAYGPADFERVSSVSLKEHDGFNVGYIGTVSYVKMHPDFVSLSAKVNLTDVKFIVCGGGGAESDILSKAKELKIEDRFDLRGQVQDIGAAIENFDVYGYPLCPETYAASEVNLQEVMYCGVAPVVFPHGGVKLLVKHNETGLIVNSAEEYAGAIEYLYRSPDERKRLGGNAAKYAREVFGAQNCSDEFDKIYELVMNKPKRSRIWSGEQTSSGARLFIESLGEFGEDFMISLLSTDERQIVAAEERISKVSTIVWQNGISPYASHFNNDPHLKLWLGLCQLRQNIINEAACNISDAIKNGLSHWRLWWYLAQITESLGERPSARALLEQVTMSAPDFEPARQMLDSLN